MRFFSVLAVSSIVACCNAYAPPGAKQETMFGRRQAMQILLGGTGAFIASGAANALDMDAFVNAQIENDTKNCDPKRDPKCIPKLTADEALCKYGQAGNARGEACKRFKSGGGVLPAAGATKVKSPGGAYAM